MPINSFLLPGAKFIPGYEVANSVRLAGDAHGQKSISSGGSGTTATFSAWIKLSAAPDKAIFTSYIDANNFVEIYFSSSSFRIYHYDGGSLSNALYTDALYRDQSSWYHFHVIFDTTNGTEASRLIITVNGTRVTSFSTTNYPTSSQDMELNSSSATLNVAARNADEQFVGYMAEVVWLDGTASAASNFGEFDEDSPTIWKPKDVSGLTFGTNGFYLDFEDSANLGNDANGGTDFTETNLAATDQTTDTPTNNFATLNPLYNNSLVYAEGNCKITEAGDWQSSFSTIGATSGKWYMEFKCSASTDGTDNFSGGICALDGVSDAAIALTVPGGSGSSIISYGYENDGTKDVKNTSSSYGSTYGSASTDIIGVYMDLDNNKLYFAKNGTVQDSGTGISIDDGYTYGFTVGDYYGTSEANFGNPTFSISSGNADANGYGNFEYDPSSGTFDSASKDFYALCTKNLAEYG